MKSLLLIAGFCLVGFIIYPLLVWAYMYLGTLFLPNPPKPEIKYGEFPFKLEYEIKGELKVIEDTLICKYDGSEIFSIGEKQRKWKTWFKSGREEIILLQINDTDYIYYNPGGPQYYMGDKYIIGETSDNGKRFWQSFPDASFFTKHENGSAEGIIRAKELLEKYSIKLINWEHTSPIVNHFY